MSGNALTFEEVIARIAATQTDTWRFAGLEYTHKWRDESFTPVAWRCLFIDLRKEGWDRGSHFEADTIEELLAEVEDGGPWPNDAPGVVRWPNDSVPEQNDAVPEGNT